MAAEWAGFKTVGQVEWGDFPTKVLAKHWPNVERWKDVRDFNATEFIQRTKTKQVTVLSGGFPCQPHSLAGLRKASADKRDLWPEYRRIIGEIKPEWVLAENVRGLLTSEDGRFFRGILRDLSELGYGVGWCTYPAAWVGAIHQRERIFTIANRHRRAIQYVGIGGDNGTGRNIAKEWCEDWHLFELGYGKVAPTEWRESGRGASRPLFCGKGDGVSDWLDRFKGLGNSVVPQQVYPILQAIADIENQHGGVS